ncbi:MAG: T9SS type A sorting domain-containing protein, partial [Ignavibacteriales bacterium]|nr:T9SS type A sorting domain-containing protein [Ignavibacteriales bacterium]
SINGVRIDSAFTKTAAFQFSAQSFPATLEPGDTIKGTITFYPQVLGSQWDTLTFVNNSPQPVVRVTLTGNGSAPVGVGNVADVVHRFDLLQNFPNPFNPSTRIDFQIAETSPVRLEIVDMLGRTVRILTTGMFEPGSHHVDWDGTNDEGRMAASGVYFYRLTAGSYLSSRKMILLK